MANRFRLKSTEGLLVEVTRQGRNQTFSKLILIDGIENPQVRFIKKKIRSFN